MKCRVDVDGGDEDLLNGETEDLDALHGCHVWKILLVCLLVRRSVLEDDGGNVEEECISDDHSEDELQCALIANDQVKSRVKND